LREARIAAQINHPNVVQVYEVLPDEDPPGLALEDVHGGSLPEVLEEQGALPGSEAGRIVDDVLAGLACIHESGIVHRHLKPANVLVDENGRAKVKDFGSRTRPRSCR
jgi:serine/threonine protein kinase